MIGTVYQITPSEGPLFDGPLPSFLQDVPVNMKGFIHSRHPRIGRQLEKDLSKLSWITADIQGGIRMEFQFIHGAQRRQHGTRSHLPFGQS